MDEYYLELIPDDDDLENPDDLVATLPAIDLETASEKEKNDYLFNLELIFDIHQAQSN